MGEATLIEVLDFKEHICVQEQQISTLQIPTQLGKENLGIEDRVSTIVAKVFPWIIQYSGVEI